MKKFHFQNTGKNRYNLLPYVFEKHILWQFVTIHIFCFQINKNIALFAQNSNMQVIIISEWQLEEMQKHMISFKPLNIT